MVGSRPDRSIDARLAAVMGWSMVQGLANLLIDEQLIPEIIGTPSQVGAQHILLMRLDCNKSSWHSLAMLQSLLAPPPRISDLDPEQAAVVTATRAWVVAQKLERCPIQATADRLGCIQAAKALRLLLLTMGAAWPDPIAVAPPCCPIVTHDEATLIAMVLAACNHSRPVFDALLCEMLPQDARDRLHSAALAFGRALA
jgi:hypothetical protein